MLEKNKNQVNTGLMQQIFILLYNCAFYALFRSGSGFLHELTKRSQSIISSYSRYILDLAVIECQFQTVLKR